MKRLAYALITLASASASAADMSVFGIEIGAPIALQECSYKQVKAVQMKLYEGRQTNTCVQDASTLKGYGEPVRRIVFSEAEAPAIVKHNRLFVIEKDGALSGIHFLTPGLAAQELVLKQLSDKYGKPTSLSRYMAETAAVPIPAISATWDLGGLLVKFEGASGGVEYGEVFIDAPAARQLRESWRTTESAPRRKL